MTPNQLPPLPEPDTHCFDDDTGKDVWSYTADQMHAYALAALAQQAQPVYWEWRHLGSNQHAADFGQWSQWQKVEARSLLSTVEDELQEFRRYIADGHKYELRALYTTPPAPQVPAPDIDEAAIARMTKRGADAWAGVDAQSVRGGEQVPAPSPQPAVPVVSAEQIRKIVESIQDPDTVPAFSNGYYTLTPDELRRAILALRPAVEPMTPEQREVLAALVVGACEHKTRTLLALRAIEATEAQYGIGITAKAEGGA